ncbi:MAG: hypothetical protein LBJ67_07280 [Planctomycetaceae bacterium]|nr:hypothetical protein [Planctomycetaceae bacterium]
MYYSVAQCGFIWLGRLTPSFSIAVSNIVLKKRNHQNYCTTYNIHLPTTADELGCDHQPIGHTTSQTRLKAYAMEADNIYPTKRKISDGKMATLNLVWNTMFGVNGITKSNQDNHSNCNSYLFTSPYCILRK